MHLLWGLWFFVAYFDIDIKCRHIAGVANRTADYLSRGNLHLFFSLHPQASSQPSPIPPPLLQIIAAGGPDWTSLWFQFYFEQQLHKDAIVPVSPREHTVTICSLPGMLKYSTQHYKGLSIFYRQFALIMQPTPRIPESPYTLQGTSQCTPSKSSPPGHSGSYTKHLCSSVQDSQPIAGNNAVGFLWVGEMTVPTQHAYNDSIHLSLEDVTLDSRLTPTLVWLTIKQSKTDLFCKGALLCLGLSSSVVCPVKALLPYLALRGSEPGSLFVHIEEQPIEDKRKNTWKNDCHALLHLPSSFVTIVRL